MLGGGSFIGDGYLCVIPGTLLLRDTGCAGFLTRQGVWWREEFCIAG
jgi:hypothetical protein